MCEFCERKPNLVDDTDGFIYYFNRYDNAYIVGEGRYNEIYYGVEVTGQPSIWFEQPDDKEVIKYFPKFCPECGRKIDADSYRCDEIKVTHYS
jgi:hypothetical protein